MRRITLSVTVLLTLALATAVTWAAAAKRPPQALVSITKGRFTPAAITIKVGETVVWINNDQMDHRIEADDGSFESGKLKAGQTYSHRFAQAGTYAYSCRLHPREKGRVVVRR